MNFQPNLWLPSSAMLPLKDGDIHIWRVWLNQNTLCIESLSKTLDSNERQRANKYHFEKDREHFIAARGMLKIILSRYVSDLPDQIRFSYNRYGKPALNIGTNDNSLRFNAAHSQELALYAVTRGREVGLDIEFINENFASLEVAKRFFSPAEILNLAALPPNLQTAAFFSCWTRKEAYIKAIGKGLSHPLKQFSVSIIPEELLPSLTINDFQETRQWSLMTLFPNFDYIAALAVEGAVQAVHQWQW